MKTRLIVEVEIDDEFVKEYNNNSLAYHTTLYKGDKERAEKTLKENPVEKALAQELEDDISNYYNVINCTVEVVKDNKLT